MKIDFPTIFRKPTVKTGQRVEVGRSALMPGATGYPGMPTVEELAPRIVAGDARLYTGGNNRPAWTYQPGPWLPSGFAGPEFSNDVQ